MLKNVKFKKDTISGQMQNTAEKLNLYRKQSNGNSKSEKHCDILKVGIQQRGLGVDQP